MGDPYWRYTASADRAGFSGYPHSDASPLPSSLHLLPSDNHISSSSDYLQKDILASRYGAYTAGTSGNGYTTPLEDKYLVGRRDINHGTPGIINERPDSLRKVNDLPVGTRESNVLFVDSLPSDCSRREVSHLFRPFLGFKEIRLVHKEPRHSGDKAMVLCFVEFSNSNHALTALETLQGYKFDYKKPDSPALQIHFAHFPFQLPSDKEEKGAASFPVQPPLDQEEQSIDIPREEQGADRVPFQLPFNREEQSDVIPREEQGVDRVPFQLPFDKEEESAFIPREREIAVQDKVVAVKRKFEGPTGPSKMGKVAVLENNRRQCVTCDRWHSGKCKVDSKKCYRCGKSGHFIRECPNPKPKPNTGGP